MFRGMLHICKTARIDVLTSLLYNYIDIKARNKTLASKSKTRIRDVSNNFLNKTCDYCLIRIIIQS